MQRLQRILVVGLTLGVVATLSVSTAFGQSAKQYKKQAKEYSKQLDALADKDKWEVSKEDRQRARQWLSQARELLAQGNSQTAGWLLTQTGEVIDLIRATIRVRELEAMADEQEETYHRMKAERIPQLESDVQQLREQKQTLGSELEKLQQ